MGYHDAVGENKKLVKDCCKFINQKERLEHALRLALKRANIPEWTHDSIVESAKNCDFAALEQYGDDRGH